MPTVVSCCFALFMPELRKWRTGPLFIERLVVLSQNLVNPRDLVIELSYPLESWKVSCCWDDTSEVPVKPLHWRHNDHDGVSNHQPHGCLLNRLFGRRSKKTSKLRVTGLCAGNSPGPVNSPHKGPATRNMFPFDDVIMFRDHIKATHTTGLEDFTRPNFKRLPFE